MVFNKDWKLSSQVPDSELVMQYKELIREQDTRLQELATELSRLRVNETTVRAIADKLEAELAQQRDENVLLRACTGDANGPLAAVENARVLVESLQAEV